MNMKQINLTKEEVFELLINSKTKKEFCNALGYKDYRSLQKICQRFDLDPNDLGKISGKIGEPPKERDVFGQLTVIEVNCSKDKKGERYSKCMCSCGQTVTVRNDFLKRGHTKTCGCGCGRDERNKIKEGMIFGRLTVIKERYYIDKAHGDIYSLCQCECGNVVKVRNNCLRRGQSSCGCLLSKGEELITKTLSKMNIPFETQYIFPDLKGKSHYPLRFDFAVFNKDGTLNCLIEYQGSQHYALSKSGRYSSEEKLKLLKEYDTKKQEYCSKKNISLFAIPYWEYEKINEQYLNELINSVNV